MTRLASIELKMAVEVVSAFGRISEVFPHGRSSIYSRERDRRSATISKEFVDSGLISGDIPFESSGSGFYNFYPSIGARDLKPSRYFSSKCNAALT